MENNKENAVLNVVAGAYNHLAHGIMDNNFATKALDAKISRVSRRVTDVDRRVAGHGLLIFALFTLVVTQRQQILKIESILQKQNNDKKQDSDKQDDKK